MAHRQRRGDFDCYSLSEKPQVVYKLDFTRFPKFLGALIKIQNNRKNQSRLSLNNFYISFQYTKFAIV